MKATRYLGTCGCCEQVLKVQKNLLVLHGYLRPGDGRAHGRCFGYNRPPHELSPEVAQDFKALCERSVLDTQQAIESLGPPRPSPPGKTTSSIRLPSELPELPPRLPRKQRSSTPRSSATRSVSTQPSAERPSASSSTSSRTAPPSSVTSTVPSIEKLPSPSSTETRSGNASASAPLSSASKKPAASKLSRTGPQTKQKNENRCRCTRDVRLVQPFRHSPPPVLDPPPQGPSPLLVRGLRLLCDRKTPSQELLRAWWVGTFPQTPTVYPQLNSAP